MKNSDVAIIIPVYNEGKVIKSVIDQVTRVFPFVVCVNDGSHDNSLEEIRKTKAFLVDHPINMGQGAALQTGLDYALLNPSIKYFVTFDADGQHSLDDVQTMLGVIKKENIDIILGSRFLGATYNMSSAKKILLKSAIRFTNIFSGIKLTDTHNGLRVFGRDFAQNLNITMPDMAHASEIIDKISHGKWKYTEVPITITYTEYSMSKGQSMFNAINILFDLFLSKGSSK